jgi:peptide/nickel transport system permease protein
MNEPAAPTRRLGVRTRSRSCNIAIAMLAAFVVVVALGIALSPYDPLAVDLVSALLPPQPGHWLGTDDLGRDVATRILSAATLDLEIALVCVALPFAIGSVIGAVSGYLGGRVDTIIMRIVDVIWAFPFYVLVIAIVGTLGPGIGNMYLAFALVVWISFARIVRGEVLVVKRLEYVQAAQVLGYGRARIVLRHILPNAITPAMVYAMADIVLTILAVTSLSFLGLGVQPPRAEWGLMIAEGRNLIFDAWWISTFPGLVIIYVGIAFTLLGDGLDDLLRPKG